MGATEKMVLRRKVNKSTIILDTNDKTRHNFHIHLLNENYFEEFMNIINNILQDDYGEPPIIIPDHFKLIQDGKEKHIKEEDYMYKFLDGYELDPNFKNVRKFTFEINEEFINKIFKATNIHKHSNKYIHYPHIFTKLDNVFVDNITCDVHHKYPIYILSKGRYFRDRKYQAPKTIQYLEEIGIKDYKVIVEEDEYENYNKSINEENLIILDRTKIDTEGDGGGIPARNFIHYLNKNNTLGAYWILDDNINVYHFANFNQRIKCNTELPFVAVEDLFDNLTNVMICGHEYTCFAPPKDLKPKLKFNCRVFSSILINNNIPTFENGNIWRGTYNEDTDLSLRMLKMGYGTFIAQHFLAKKECTNGGVKGGNHSTIYKQDNKGSGTLKTNALLELHSDIVEPVKQFWINKNKTELGKRDHHKINYEKLYELYGKPNIINEMKTIIKYNIQYNYKNK